MSATVACPPNVSAITLGDGAHSPVGSPRPLLTDASDADTNILVYEYTQPDIVSTLPNGNIKISLPPNITSITVNGNVLIPDGTPLNTITGNAADLTIVQQTGFTIISELS
jgi:hypothetical protein